MVIAAPWLHGTRILPVFCRVRGDRSPGKELGQRIEQIGTNGAAHFSFDSVRLIRWPINGAAFVRFVLLSVNCLFFEEDFAALIRFHSFNSLATSAVAAEPPQVFRGSFRP